MERCVKEIDERGRSNSWFFKLFSFS
jgi:hypothetical protein